MAFKNRTAQERQRAKELRAEQRRRTRASVLHSAINGCFSYVAATDCRDSRAASTWLKTYTFLEGGSRTRESKALKVTLTAISYTTLQRQIRTYLTACKPTVASRRRLLRDLKSFASCDGRITDAETTALREIADMLQISATTRLRMRRACTSQRTGSELRNKTHQAQNEQRKQKGRVPPPPPPRCYQILGCTEGDSDDTIKRAYRRLASVLHPDRHAARAKTPDEMLPHIRAFQELQAAYEEILEKRKTSSGTN